MATESASKAEKEKSESAEKEPSSVRTKAEAPGAREDEGEEGDDDESAPPPEDEADERRDDDGDDEGDDDEGDEDHGADEGDDDEGDEDEDEEGDEGDEEEAAAKPAAKAGAAKTAAAGAAKAADAKAGATGASAAGKAAAKATAKAKGQAAKGKKPARSGISLRNVILFGGLVAILLAFFGVWGSHDNGGPANVWRLKLNEPVNVEITLVTSDARDLGCAMDGEVAGLHCGFDAQNKKNEAAKGSRDDAKLLQPYSTTDHRNFMAAGLWMEPELKDANELEKTVNALPNPRFSVNCKFTPKGRAKAGTKVQWKQGNDWGPGDDWYVGTVSGCKLAK